MIDNNYIEELYKFLSHEQWTSSIVSKLHKDEFQELVQILFYKAEHDGKIVGVKTSPKLDETVDWAEAMRDITRRVMNLI